MTPPHIVLIEDNPADVFLIKLALKENGVEHTLTHFERADQAIQVLCSDTQGNALVPHAILLDLNTPGGADGFDALHRFKTSPRLSDIPIAVLTSSRDAKDKERVTIQGARYIEKASQLNEFLASVGKAVKQMLDVSQIR